MHRDIVAERNHERSARCDARGCDTSFDILRCVRGAAIDAITLRGALMLRAMRAAIIRRDTARRDYATLLTVDAGSPLVTRHYATLLLLFRRCR